MFEVFDLPEQNVTAGARNVSTVPTQALTLLNNPFVFAQAQLFADRVRKEAGDDLAKQVDLAYRIALTRPPTATEQALALDAGAPACAEASADELARQSHSRAVQSERVRLHQVTVMKTCKTCWSRRDFLYRSGGGVSGLALAYLLNQDTLLAAGAAAPGDACGAKPIGFNPYAPKAPHFKPRAKAVISLFMSGGVSQVDTFDPKPALNKYAGQPLDGKVTATSSSGRGIPVR